MRALTEQALAEGKIMVVDDNPTNLKLLEDMLREHGYDVRSFPRGRLALTAVEQEPPDLILLDINMPEMNGYEVCEQLKASAGFSSIPVIFLSALSETEDKVKGFRAGGIDYIAKPFQFEEVLARVETHLKLPRAQQAEHDLLEKTLGGAVGTLWELVQITSPRLALRSRAIRDIVRWITTQLAIADPWQYELGATLCLLGCVAMPDEVFERAYCGQSLSPDEKRMFQAHPETAARLLSSIPRLEIVVSIILSQLKPQAEAPATDEHGQGSQMLHLALELDRRIYRGIDRRAALAELRIWRQFDSRMLDALESYAPPQAEFDVRRLPVRALRAGMVLETNVSTRDGSLTILNEGTVLTETWIQRLDNFARTRGVQEPLSVRVPRLPGAHESAEFDAAVPAAGANRG